MIKWSKIDPDHRPMEWSLLSDGKFSIWFGRWSPSHYAYIGQDLQPLDIKNSHKTVTLVSEPIVDRIVNLPEIFA